MSLLVSRAVLHPVVKRISIRPCWIKNAPCVLHSQVHCTTYSTLHTRTTLPKAEFVTTNRPAQCNYSNSTFSGAPSAEVESELSESQYEVVAEDTLESLTDTFEEIADSDIDTDMDVTYSSGVLTVKFGSKFGTYVINKQTPNRQIWLSSPTSGPKRYDFKNGTWIYKRDSIAMHKLLSDEISVILKKSMDFELCSYGKSK